MRLTNLLSGALCLVRQYGRSYLVLNLVYYGIVGAAMLYAVYDRQLQETVLEAVQAGIKGPLAPIAAAYATGLLPAIALTFVVNLVGGSFLSITLPSLVIPFSGLLVAAFRAALWGLIFAPATLYVTPPEAMRGVLIGLLIFLEGQGYVLTMLAAYVQGKSFLLPASVAAAGRWQGYRMGVSRSLRLYLLVSITLAVAAIYEAVIVIVVLPRLA